MSQLRLDDTASAAVPAARRDLAFAQLARRTFGALSVSDAESLLEMRPDPVATIRRSGASPYRILCFGGGALRGVGFHDHDHGLPGRIADRVVAQTRRGVQVDVVVEDDSTTPRALALLRGLRLQRYDAVIVVLGGEAAGYGTPDRWRGALVGLARLLQNETSPDAGVFVYDTAQAAPVRAGLVFGGRNDHRERLAAVTEEVCALVQRVRFAELRPLTRAADLDDKLSDSAATAWADLIVGRLKPTFEALAAAGQGAAPRRFRNTPHDERFRQRAVEALRLRRGERDDRLDRELATARSMYRTSKAALTVLDGDLQWSKASADDLVEIPRADGFCNFAIRSDELTLINDTWLDPRSSSSPLAQGEHAIRFYAGFPVRSLDGYRVGMVCVYGGTPRAFRPSDLEGLRDVAGRIEQVLWNDLLRTARR